jgi:hypothetical protein
MSSDAKCFGGECLPRLPIEEIYAIALEIWPDPALAAEMAATAMSESGGIPNRLGKAGEYGLWQIHPMHFDPTHAEWIGADKYNNPLKKLGIIDGEGQSLSDPRINARAADAIARHLDRYTDHWDEGDLDMDTVFYGRRDNPDFSLFLEQAQALIGSDPLPTPPDEPLDDLGPGNSEFDPPTFTTRVEQALKDPNTPKAIPLPPLDEHEFTVLQQGTEDPALKAALSKHAGHFRTHNAGFLGYETDEEANTAAKWLRIYGIGVDSQFPFIAYSLGKQAIDKTGDIASQLWDKAIGSLWGGGDGIDRSAYLDYGSDEISDDLNPERR